MAINLDKIPKFRRLKLIALGQQFGSQDTLDQANQTLSAYAKHAAQLTLLGFAAQHATELTEARDGLEQAGVGREEAKGKKKVTAEAYVEAFLLGTTSRIRTRAVLVGVKEDFEGREDDAAVEAQRILSAALRQTRAAAKNAEPLAQQLALLAGVLKNPVIAGEASGQGGPEALADVEAAIVALRKADQEDVGGRGTPMETQTLDLLDGIIVQQVRRARRAAVAAAKQTGNPALVDAFKLDKLYRSKGGIPVSEEEAAAPDEEDGQVV